MGAVGQAVISLGTPGGDLCADGSELAAGVHVLWTLDPGLGFPAGGYDVARREHQPPEWLCLPFDQAGLPAPGDLSWDWGAFTLTVTAGAVRLDHRACDASTGLVLPGTRTLTVTNTNQGVAARVTGTGGRPTVEVLGRASGRLAVLARARPRLVSAGWSAELWGADVEAVRITGDDVIVCTLCIGMPVPEAGWRELTRRPVLLPVVPPGTSNVPDLIQDRAATLAQARARLPGSLSPTAADQLASAFAGAPRETIELLLRQGPGARVPAAAAEAGQARAAPQLGLGATTLLAVAALDPDVSRMLGLTWHDPVRTGRWDYRVTAHYGPVPFPATSIRFDELSPGDRPPGSLRVGAVTVVGTSGLQVTEAPDAPAVLRVGPPLPGTQAGLILPAGVRSVRLHLAGTPDGDAGPSHPVTFTARRADTVVDTAVADGDGLVLLEDPADLDAVTWDDGPVDLTEIALSGTPGVVGDVTAYTWNVSAADPVPVQPLAITALAAAADTPAPGPDGRLPRCAGVVGLDWRPAVDVPDAGRPVQALVGLSPRGSGGTAAPDGPFTVVNADRPGPAASRTRGPGGAWPGPGVPQGWTERVGEPGWYALRVRGVDAFGRLGPWTAERTTEVRTAPVPGTPDAVSARYLDPADPALSDSDRQLSGGTPGLVVEWTWPAGRRLQSPAVDESGEFRIYLRRGDPNLAPGTVLGVARASDQSRLSTDLDWPGAADALTGQFLRTGGASYPILAHGSGPGTWFDVALLDTPLRRPGSGPFTITVAAGARLYVGLDQATDFDRRLAVVATAAAPALTSAVLAITPSADGAELTLADPLPAGDGAIPAPGVAAVTVPGLFHSRGVGYPVTGQEPGSPVLQIAAAGQPGGAALVPQPDDAGTVWPGTRYQAWLPGVRLVPGPADAFAVAFVGVGAADGDPLVADDPRWDAPARGGLGGRPGRQGPTGRPARVSVPHRAPPPALPVTRPPTTDDMPAVRAEPADWYGRAHYTLPLAPVDGAVGYRVLRASTAALFGYDARLRRTGQDPYADGPFPGDAASAAWLAEHHPDLSAADLTADPASLPGEVAAEVAQAWRDWSAWFYPGLSNRSVMDLADLDSHREAFQPAHSGTVTGPSFRDTLDGRGLGRFLYRVRTVDASGAAGPWSVTFPVVEVRDVTAPKTPTVLSAAGDENAVVITWRRGTEPDLTGYRVWRATDPDDLADVRRLPVHAELPADTAASDGALSYTWTDGGLAATGTWFYRLAAVDTAGNVSAPTGVLRARPIDTEPPEPPTWIRAERVPGSGDGTALADLGWTVDEDGVTCLVERRRDRDQIFTSRTGWLVPAAGTREFAWLDDDPGPGVVTYRIRARDVTGNEQRYRWNPVTLAPDGEDA